MNSTPMFRSVSCINVWYPATWMAGPNGITAIESSAIATARKGANRYSGMLTYDGIMSSLVTSLMTSASGCSSPCGPTRYGPGRTWMCAITFRSTHCK